MKSDNTKEIVDNLVRLCGSVTSSLVPEEAKSHFRRAAREFLFGMAAILDEKGKSGDEGSPEEDENKSRKINIE